VFTLQFPDRSNVSQLHVSGLGVKFDLGWGGSAGDVDIDGVGIASDGFDRSSHDAVVRCAKPTG